MRLSGLVYIVTKNVKLVFEISPLNDYVRLSLRTNKFLVSLVWHDLVVEIINNHIPEGYSLFKLNCKLFIDSLFLRNTREQRVGKHTTKNIKAIVCRLLTTMSAGCVGRTSDEKATNVLYKNLHALDANCFSVWARRIRLSYSLPQPFN